MYLKPYCEAPSHAQYVECPLCSNLSAVTSVSGLQPGEVRPATCPYCQTTLTIALQFVPIAIGYDRELWEREHV